jgi:hypothetical protein
MYTPFPLVLSLSKDASATPMGFDKLSPNGGC